MDLGLTGKTAYVFDAGSTLGGAVADRLIAEGATVVRIDRDDERLDAVAAWSGEVHLAWLSGLLDEDIAESARLIDAVADRIAAHGGGSIVVHASVAASLDVPGVSPERAATAAALVQLARITAVRRAADGVQVNAVLPGGILDETSGEVIDAAAVPLGAPRPSADVADVVAFLLSPLAAYTTGQAIVIDGGASVI